MEKSDYLLRPCCCWIIIKCLFVLVLTDLNVSFGYLHRPGRHVCSNPHVRMETVKTTQSYCKPVYSRAVFRCPSGFGMCNTMRVMYTVGYRERYNLQPATTMTYYCCPGWSQYSPSSQDCLKPICERGCRKGRCKAPNVCSCRQGWQGNNCQQDVDECSEENGNKLCHQKCMNTIGSFRCGCFPGFTLDTDKNRCTFCLQCTTEYKHLVKNQSLLYDKLDHLQREKIDLQRNLTRKIRGYDIQMKTTFNRVQNIFNQTLRDNVARINRTLQEKIQNLKTKIKRFERPPGDLDIHPESNGLNNAILDNLQRTPGGRNVNDAPKPDPYLLDLIKSLTVRISALEERLETCKCDHPLKRRVLGDEDILKHRGDILP
ncbi:uncharacterized protein LOC141908575 [Tubulanus polymorphus]|uniref:uncharacterized protein LOC141908575 n=1 Tax=Tubulanus polymorphus TaxID=672921 RepID=UPI003DA5D2B1